MLVQNKWRHLFSDRILNNLLASLVQMEEANVPTNRNIQQDKQNNNNNNNNNDNGNKTHGKANTPRVLS